MEEVKLQPRQLIKCPHCSWEYLPGELFFPINTIGYPINIVRDPLGKILYEEYPKDKEPLAEESYICDNCNKPFTIDINISYKTHKVKEEKDFSDTNAQLW